MSERAEPWTELTAFEHCEPSPLAFRAMAALLDTWPGDDRSAAIDYAEALLSKWPDAVRLAPWSWCKAASKGETPPTWRLVRTLQLVPGHLTKRTVNLAWLAQRAELEQITELEIPRHSDHQELSFLYHRPKTFPSLKRLRAADKYKDGDVRALAASPIWPGLEQFEIEELTDSLAHRNDASRIVPQLKSSRNIQHLTLRSPDLIAVWEANDLPNLRSASVFVRSVNQAVALAARKELSQLNSLSLAFRCGFSGSSPFEPFLGNVIEADEAAADAFFRAARLDRLEKLAIIGYSMGYWGREGMGRLGLNALIASGLLKRVKHLRLELLPLGDQGIATLAPALGPQLETLELPDVYCKGMGAAALMKSPCLPWLRRLDLSANRIDAEHFVQLAQAEAPNLQSLDLSGPRINPYYWDVGQQPLLDAGAEAWARSLYVERLTHLRLSNCHLTDVALAAIFQSPRLAGLQYLDLSHNCFTAAAIEKSVVGSPLWQTLREVGLNHCRLDNAAIEALSQVQQAPALRVLELAYNSLGPRGAAALANWPVLAHVWRLHLHDNLIGDEGLIALAESPYLGRLLELDLEQDCWNSRAFDFSDRAAQALAASTSLRRLDSLFSGCVDEYHGAAYSPGFSKAGLDALRKSERMRPAFRACSSDFSGIEEYMESPEFNEQAELKDHDFRRHPFTLNEKEAPTHERRMQQIRSPAALEEAPNEDIPPAISPPVELFPDDEGTIEGIGFRDAKPVTDHSFTLRVSLEDDEYPLPRQAGKLLADTLDAAFKAASIGSFQPAGGSSRIGDDGRTIPIDDSFYVAIKGDPRPAIQLIREALWWIGAPADTDHKDYHLALDLAPVQTAGRLLQLATPKIVRWSFQGEPGHRIDRVPFTTAQRACIRDLLTESGGAEGTDGWTTISTADGGCMAAYTRYLDDADDLNTLTIFVDSLTPQISSLVHALMLEGEFMLLPMAFAPSERVAQAMDCQWPEVELAAFAADLHELLRRGPYQRWHSKG